MKYDTLKTAHPRRTNILSTPPGFAYQPFPFPRLRRLALGSGTRLDHHRFESHISNIRFYSVINRGHAERMAGTTASTALAAAVSQGYIGEPETLTYESGKTQPVALFYDLDEFEANIGRAKDAFGEGMTDRVSFVPIRPVQRTRFRFRHSHIQIQNKIKLV